jgi:hypothetical protein
MYDTGKVLLGIVIFVALVASPLWYNALFGTSMEAPELKLPADSQMCIEATDYMRANHMEMLNEWRDQVVREGQRVYVANNGDRYVKSLTNTCLGCHTNKAEFCDACHNYMAVSPYCWDCHVDPKEVQ